MKIVETFKCKNLPGMAHIVYYDNVGYRVMCENKDGISDDPIDYNLWNPNLYGIAYDHPERYPNYVKSLVRRAYKRLKQAYPIVI